MDIAKINSAASVQAQQRREMADGLEQAFLSEMLKYAGPREDSGEFGGGIGESQFASLLNDAYSQAIAKRIDLKILARSGYDHG